jgi:hypothetical protein
MSDPWDWPLEEQLEWMRDRGWTVAVHNDYKLKGVAMTFWLFTHAEKGVFVKGEGMTDERAIYQCILGVERRFK